MGQGCTPLLLCLKIASEEYNRAMSETNTNAMRAQEVLAFSLRTMRGMIEVGAQPGHVVELQEGGVRHIDARQLFVGAPDAHAASDLRAANRRNVTQRSGERIDDRLPIFDRDVGLGTKQNDVSDHAGLSPCEEVVEVYG